MNLNEALDILESNNYICEFLEYSVSREKLKTLIEKEFNLQLIEDPEEYGTEYAESMFDADLACIFTAKNCKNLKPLENKLEEFTKKYGWHLRYAYRNTMALENIHELKREIDTEGIYMHISCAPPEVILRTGLRPKSFNGRVYIEKLDTNVCFVGLKRGIPKDAKMPKELDDFKYRYVYFIEFPEKKATYYIDPEFDETEKSYFVYETIPPKYIKYIGYKNF